MSFRALPILFINLGGEMMYILDQRLTAQNIPADKAAKVLNDIIGTMLNIQFLEELFRPQILYSKAVLKSAFEKLAHASIMRLNTSSMDKLYDLIVMAFKYQLLMCPRPSDLLLITLNHVDALRTMASSEQVQSQIEMLYDYLIKGYSGMGEGEFQSIRHELMNFFQDLHIRVSMFLKDKSQNPNGRFTVPTSVVLPFGTEIPGAIRLFNSSGTMYKTTYFQNGGQYSPAHNPGSKERNGSRWISLGTNMYSSIKPSTCMEETTVTSPRHSNPPQEVLENPTLAKEELNFLVQLIGSSKQAPQKAEFRLHLFDFAEEEEPVATKPLTDVKENVFEVTPTKSNDELVKIMGEMESVSLTDSKQSDDLLDLMDVACD